MDTAGQLDVLGHDGDTLGVDVTQVCVFEEDLNLRSVLKSWTISWTRHWKGSLRMRSSVLFWQRLISRRATVPGLYPWGSRLFGNLLYCRENTLRPPPYLSGPSVRSVIIRRARSHLLLPPFLWWCQENATPKCYYEIGKSSNWLMLITNQRRL